MKQKRALDTQSAFDEDQSMVKKVAIVGHVDHGTTHLREVLRDLVVAHMDVNYYPVNTGDIDIEPLKQQLMEQRKPPVLEISPRFRIDDPSNWQPGPPRTVTKVPARNSLCSCGSGKKYKRCCIDKPLND